MYAGYEPEGELIDEVKEYVINSFRKKAKKEKSSFTEKKDQSQKVNEELDNHK